MTLTAKRKFISPDEGWMTFSDLFWSHLPFGDLEQWLPYPRTWIGRDEALVKGEIQIRHLGYAIDLCFMKRIPALLRERVPTCNMNNRHSSLGPDFAKRPSATISFLLLASAEMAG
ncbi:hypothetical protein CIHG_01140 [Coccidioides immitis H538.4]|uniref:Uncharacterized protein n=1 Tax=Coccidioides immitis H538.4 TaxID=396776 RepID=A0A0J8U8H1_COCIT|nr:hypothetical protein CIHG_01140 [Coccidioides immitis H538.4]